MECRGRAAADAADHRAARLADPGPDRRPQGFFETLFAYAQRGRLTAEIEPALQNLLTMNDPLLPGSFTTGPPKWAQRITLGGIAAVSRARGRKPYS